MTAIIDYEAGNLASVQRACKEVGLDARLCADPDALRKASRVIFPGVGAAGSAMASLCKHGLDEALHEVIRNGVPVLGICLGMQFFLDHSAEQDTPTLGLIAGTVERFDFANASLKVPHMGWNNLLDCAAHPVLADIQAEDEFYFVHSYYADPEDSAMVLARAEYERTFAAAIGRDNFIGTQFHPEKSGRVGLRLIANFAQWEGSC
ncbi:MAG TPA: imidazole glycerol phosphate synthase subunit HisH [Gammaproteobacteria bacterium]|nr:imidazole glycerol phosphate synthase subunit HisH [Gammaproteobacteria bacterium]